MKSIFFILIAAVAGRAATSGEAAQLTAQAERLYLQSRYTEAEPVFRMAVDAWTALGPNARRNRALAMSDLGSLLRALGRYSEAEPMLAEALRDLEPGADASRTLWNLATLYRCRGELSKAESYAIRAVEMVEGPDRVAPKLVLASVYTAQHRYPEAQEILAWAAQGAGDALRVGIDNNLSLIALATGDYSRAEQFAREGIELARTALPEQHPAIAKLKMNLGALYHLRGREHGAEILFREAAAIIDSACGPDHPLALAARKELVAVLRAERRFTEAAALEKRIRLSAASAGVPETGADRSADGISGVSQWR